MNKQRLFHDWRQMQVITESQHFPELDRFFEFLGSLESFSLSAEEADFMMTFIARFKD
ncbi:hypothetical protein Q8W26_06455 [Psychrobium sp. 1_MG-2023]|nr:hypothetical protein [Psychrobium sp. 1_MG-2023]